MIKIFEQLESCQESLQVKVDKNEKVTIFDNNSRASSFSVLHHFVWNVFDK